MRFFKALIVVLIANLLFATSAQATHVYATHVSYQCIGQNQYVVQLITYQDCGAIPPSGQLNVTASSVSCGANQTFVLPLQSTQDISFVCPGTPSPCSNGGYGTYLCTYTDTITLSSCSDWIISHQTCCRGNFSNLSSSTNYVYGSTTLDNSTTCNNSVQTNNTAYPTICANAPYVYYMSAYDVDGDSLSFSLVNALTGTNGTAAAYNPGFSGSNPMGATVPVSIDPATGDLTFTPNSTLGVFLVAVQIDEYRNGVLIASSYRDIAIFVINCTTSNSPPIYTVSNVQGGVFLNNVFYVSPSSTLTFDLTASDTFNLTDTVSIDSDIDSIGGSFSTSGHNPTVGSFTWNASAPLPRDFNVSIADDYCLPNGGQELGFAIQDIAMLDNCSPDSIQGIVVTDSTFEICVTCNGTIDTIFSPMTTTYGSMSLDANTNCMVYHSGPNEQVQEAFWLYYGYNGGQDTDSIWVDLTTVSCVWAGDTDTSKVVNHFDLLPIGLGYGETGPLRPNADLNYDCEPALNFANSTPMTNINYKHSDTDGNGVVNATDTNAIILNWGQVHLRNNHSHAAQTGIPFYVEHTVALPNQNIQIPVILGDSITNADSIYGVAFTINYDYTLTDSNSVFVDFNNSWLGTINTDMIDVQKDFYLQGKIDVAVTRIDQSNRNGVGQIATLNLTIKDDILRSPVKRLDLQISNVRLISNIETEYTTTTPATDVLITTATGLEPIATEVQLQVFPNPAKDYIQLKANENIQEAAIYSLTGQLLTMQQFNQNNVQLNTQQLGQGIYLLKVQTQHGIKTEKIQIID